ncbi:hypothetical protein PHYBOEH_001986 [Phytophthora boehmeriae]|uniref:RRM domain-containing protein n=1 Tax=Phytophthora boehmeriae TaxID=109152 RepID=A0A8T1WRD2_9STRA|nr:hypothetical protein PHYBOEH_001986 [Phytophthora boehmeriae]
MPAVEELSSAKKRKLEDVKMEESGGSASPQSVTESERSCGKETPTETKEALTTAAKGEEAAVESPKTTVESRKTAVQRLLEPLSREQLLEILANAATRYDALYAELKAAAGVDVAHRKVFVRGLAWETKTENLKEAFAAFGDVLEGAVIYDKATGKSRGYGFVTFVEMEAAQRAVQQQTVVIDKFGELEEAAIARDRQTSRSKGYGFVTYKHKAGAERALQTPQKFIDGRTTVCNLACQGHNKSHTEQRGGATAFLAPVAPSYAMPMQPVGVYTTVPYQGMPAMPQLPQMPHQPNAYGQYPTLPSPYGQQPQTVYTTPQPYYQGRPHPQPPHQQATLQQQPPPPPRR